MRYLASAFLKWFRHNDLFRESLNLLLWYNSDDKGANMIFDTHIHLTEPEISEHLDEMIREAKARDVTRFVTIGYDEASSREVVTLASNHPGIWASVGLQPEEVVKERDFSLSWVRELSSNAKVVAIGEIGLDYHWTKETKELQKEFFLKQLALARECKLPVIIHARDAMQDTYDILAQAKVRGIMHCWSGTPEMAERFVKLGYYLGIGGVLTYPSARHVKESVMAVGIEHLVVETDAPYLAPVPHRGEVNRPAFIRDTVEYLAALLSLSVNEVSAILTKNALDCFGLLGTEETA